jgi:nicotinamidase/pyrazinamidase
VKVLLIVDVQHDFCPGGALAVHEGDQIVKGINALIEQGGYDLIVATRDYHPTQHVSFASSHAGKHPIELLDMPTGQQMLWPDHCVQGSWGAELHAELDTQRLTHIVDKGLDRSVDSYSGFFDNDRRAETPLRALIAEQARGEKVTVDICGLALDYCVSATARDAAELGYETNVIYDLTRAVEQDPNKICEILQSLADTGVQTVLAVERMPVERVVERPQRMSSQSQNPGGEIRV